MQATPSSTLEQSTRECDGLFHGLGKSKDCKVKLHIDKSVPLVAQAHRRAPFPVRKQLEEQLRNDEELGVIERAGGLTPWVSPLVVAPKHKSPGKTHSDPYPDPTPDHSNPRVTETVRLDNGPPFDDKDFRNFAPNLGFLRRKVTPLWQRVSGEVERFAKTVKKVVRTAAVELKPWKEELVKSLRAHRATPHSSTGKGPATTLFNRPLRVKLPEVQTECSDEADIKHQDDEAKRKMKEYADRKSYVKPSNYSVGDTVLVKRDKAYRKSLTPYDPEPYEITMSKGSMVTASNGEKAVTRNSSFFKPIEKEEPDTPGAPG